MCTQKYSKCGIVCTIEETLKSFVDERILSIELEVKNIFSVISSIVEKLGTNTNLRPNIKDVDKRIARIEEKLAAY